MSTEGKKHALTPEEIKLGLYEVVRARLKGSARRPTGYVQVELEVSSEDPNLILGVTVWCTAKPWGKHPVKV